MSGKIKHQCYGKWNYNSSFTCKLSSLFIVTTGVFRSDTTGMSVHDIDGETLSADSVDCPVQTKSTAESAKSG